LDVERDILRAVQIAPAIIDELTKTISTEMIDKQAVVEQVKRLQDRLRWLQAETQKKSWIIGELNRMIIPRSSDNDFQHLVDDTQVQNECHFENLQIAGFETEGLEKERASLIGILRDSETDNK
jgi:hypothetical protein